MDYDALLQQGDTADRTNIVPTPLDSVLTESRLHVAVIDRRLDLLEREAVDESAENETMEAEC